MTEGQRASAMDSSRTQSEFTRQAEAMAASPAFRDDWVTERFVRALERCGGGRILDLACGPGLLIDAAAPTAALTIGADLTWAMLQKARQRVVKGRVAFVQAHAAALPFADATFDAAITRLSFHHLRDVPHVLAELRRRIKVGGWLIAADIVSSPDPDEAMLHNALEQLRDPTHIGMMSSEALRGAIEAAGFTLQDEQSWRQRRRFDEWAAIVNDPARTAPLRHLIRALARRGSGGWLELEARGDELLFVHTWSLVVAQRRTI